MGEIRRPELNERPEGVTTINGILTGPAVHPDVREACEHTGGRAADYFLQALPLTEYGNGIAGRSEKTRHSPPVPPEVGEACDVDDLPKEYDNPDAQGEPVKHFC